ncbi:hypothetical protein RvY_00382 [Ramazzottius varieornatus]|uniref:Uncharacterized protein n=1 Tax=Ramazzottius varieornatus TaxID=947166 RepID=A0A1D1UIV9_RAMVA|nr:hypothetical protein RvY_00382 [Ramazzottius varieornatus]
MAECARRMIKTKIVAASANPSSQKLEQLVDKIHQLQQEIDKVKEKNTRLRVHLGLAETSPSAPDLASGVTDSSSPSSPDRRARVKAGGTTDNHSKSISRPPGIKKKK